MVGTTRWVKESGQTGTRFHISSLKGKEPRASASFTRGHRGIENKLHRHLDVGVGEDASQIKKDNGPQDMPATRKLALFIIGKDNNKMSIERKRKKAARNNQFLLNLFKNL